MTLFAGHPLAMLTEIYIEALPVDEELADQVWEAWDKGEIYGQVAWLGWWLIVERRSDPRIPRVRRNNISA